MTFCGFLFLSIAMAAASAHNVAPGQEIFRFQYPQDLVTHIHPQLDPAEGAEQKAIGDFHRGSSTLQLAHSTCPSRITVDLPQLLPDNWYEDQVTFSKCPGPSVTVNTSFASNQEKIHTWHHRKLKCTEFTTVETLQSNRLQLVSHPEFCRPVMLKTASFPSEMASLELETSMYRLLHGTGVTPEFLGHVIEEGRVVGFITEFIGQLSSRRGRDMGGCLDALETMHAMGVAHGDAHDGNCLLRANGTGVMIDFELAVETWDHREFERDLDIMGRCIQALD